MDPLRKYDINYVGLKEKVHEFDYEVDDKFFELFSDPLIKNADLQVKLRFDRRTSFFILDFNLNGKVHSPCDRCGAEIDYPVDSDYNIVVKFDEHREEANDDSMADVVYISRNDSHINVAQLIYEFISLSVPINHVNCDNLRGPKPCNFEVLEKLEHQHEEEEKTTDHRWDDLAKIKFN